jgi:N-methylhydantoinase A
MGDRVRVGIDVGGTFTDLVAHPSTGGTLRMLKVPTTPDPSEAVVAGLQALLGPHDEVASLTHGTTVVTNAMLEGGGARTALVTTRGFRDVLEIGRQQRDHLYRLDVPGRVPPPVPRSLRYEVTERMDHAGRVLVPLDEADVRRVATALRRARVDAVAICLLHAYVNPSHERRIAELLAGAVPHLSLSSDVNAEYREYERTHTTCANALLAPLVDRYLTELEAGLAGAHRSAPLRLMQSSGGMATPAAMRRIPLALLVSGPAGGVAAAQAVAARAGVLDAVTLDMGGTSTDVCLIRDGRVETVSERRVAGQPVRMRSLAVESIGAGGGSIARVDTAGALRVGPQSAGAVPGPACYGRGGEEATVTDACVVLGYVNPEASFGGVRLDPARAWRAIEAVGSRLALAAPDAAAGIVEIACAAMTRAIRTVSVHRGYDVRRCCLIAYGGAGPIHAGRLAQTLGMSRVLVPSHSSAFSAYGCLVADLRYDGVRTVRVRLRDGLPSAWEGVFRQMEVELLTQLEREEVLATRVVLRRSMDLRYEGQNYEIEVPVEPGEDGEAIRRRFTEIHRRLYEYATDEAVEGVNLRVAALVPTPAAPVSAASSATAGEGAVGTRRAHYYGLGWIPTPVHPRGGLSPGREIDGPAILEDAWSTILVYPGQRCRCDALGHLWIEATP